MLIENRRGASGIIAANFAAKSAPDGYTWLLVSSGFLVNIAMGRKMAFDPFKDFEAVTELGIVPNIVVVNADSKIHSIKDSYRRGQGRAGQAQLRFRRHRHRHAPCNRIVRQGHRHQDGAHPVQGNASGADRADGGRIQVIFAGAPPALPLVRTGKIRAIAVTSRNKSPVAPDLPPISATVPGFDGVTWYVLLVPHGTPKPIVDKLNATFKKVLADPSLQATLLKRGFVAESSTPAVAAKDMRDKVDTYSKIIKEAGIRRVH